MPSGNVATAVVVALAAGGLSAADLGAFAAASPVLQTLTYTSTGPVGGLYHPVAISAANGTVYVSNSGANIVATISGTTTTAFAGSLSAYGEHGDGGQATAAAALYHPGGSAVDANGDVFIADSGDNVVREVTPDGVIHLATPASARLEYPQAVAVDAHGNLWISNTYDNQVVEVAANGRVEAAIGNGRPGYAGDGGRAANAELNQPTGLAFDAKGNLYIADSGNNVIRRVDAATGVITTVAGDFAADQASGCRGPSAHLDRIRYTHRHEVHRRRPRGNACRITRGKLRPRGGRLARSR